MAAIEAGEQRVRVREDRVSALMLAGDLVGISETPEMLGYTNR